MARLEHVNVTVADPKATAAMLVDLFDWTVRWEGSGMQTGYTVHVGDADSYVALFGFGDAKTTEESRYHTLNGLNHIGIVVDDIEAAEARVKAAGYEPTNHGNYEPGRRFYFEDGDGVEFEVVAYD